MIQAISEQQVLQEGFQIFGAIQVSSILGGV